MYNALIHVFIHLHLYIYFIIISKADFKSFTFNLFLQVHLLQFLQIFVICMSISIASLYFDMNVEHQVLSYSTDEFYI